MIRLLIIADDLTGALDSGVKLAEAGIPTEVRISPGCPDSPDEEFEASTLTLVVDTQTRHLPAGEAYARVESLVHWARKKGIRLFYKKTDSTLRGNLGVEMAALMNAGGGGPLVFAPAFPALGRTTEGGRQYVNGVPLEDTVFARDLLNPVRTGSVREILRQGVDLDVREVEPSGLAAALREAGEQEKELLVIVVNGRTEEDLAETARALARALARSRNGGRSLRTKGDGGGASRPLLAGCAGFAAHLPELLGFHRAEPEKPRLRGPLVAVNGSLHPVSLGQTRAAIRSGFLDVALEPEEILSPEAREEAVRKIVSASMEGRPCALRSVLHDADFQDYRRKAEEFGLPPGEIHKILPRFMGDIVRDAASRAVMGTLVVFGGDTLGGILEAFGKRAIVPLAETFSGVVAARVPGVPNPRHLVSKAGGFGDDEFLIELLRLIRDP